MLAQFLCHSPPYTFMYHRGGWSGQPPEWQFWVPRVSDLKSKMAAPTWVPFKCLHIGYPLQVNNIKYVKWTHYLLESWNEWSNDMVSLGLSYTSLIWRYPKEGYIWLASTVHLSCTISKFWFTVLLFLTANHNALDTLIKSPLESHQMPGQLVSRI